MTIEVKVLATCSRCGLTKELLVVGESVETGRQSVGGANLMYVAADVYTITRINNCDRQWYIGDDETVCPWCLQQSADSGC